MEGQNGGDQGSGGSFQNTIGEIVLLIEDDSVANNLIVLRNLCQLLKVSSLTLGGVILP